MEEKRVPRGIRNNNPLNIRRTFQNWKGKRANYTDEVFEEFESLTWGLRAGFKLLHTYMTVYKLRTVKSIISRWAPSNENDTERYITYVSRAMCVLPNQIIYFSDRNKMVELVRAMCTMECGVVVSYSEITVAYDIVVNEIMMKLL